MPSAWRSETVGLGAVVMLVTLAGCGAGNAASHIATVPEYEPPDQTRCSTAKNRMQPLVVEWPSADRAKLEVQAKHGLVVVRYSGCEMQVLDKCSVGVRYMYNGVTPKKDRLAIHEADDLYSNVPLGAAGLEGQLRKSGELDVDTTIVGRWAAEKATVALEGSCEGATHVVSAMTVGAFTFSTSAAATVGGDAKMLGAETGGTSKAKRLTLSQDGDETACAKAEASDSRPPEGCGAPIRLELTMLTETDKLHACPTGQKWNGKKCESGGSALPFLALLLFM